MSAGLKAGFSDRLLKTLLGDVDISSVGDSVTDAINNISSGNTKTNVTKDIRIIVPSSGWAETSDSNYPYLNKISVQNISENDNIIWAIIPSGSDGSYTDEENTISSNILKVNIVNSFVEIYSSSTCSEDFTMLLKDVANIITTVSSYVDLTQDEYNQLSKEEQENGDYFITDAEDDYSILDLKSFISDISKAQDNLIPYPYSNTTLTVNGITFTDNEDGTITANGTNTESSFVYFYCCKSNSDDPLILDAGTYSFSGCPNDSSTFINIGSYDSNGDYYSIKRYYNTTEDLSFTLTETTKIQIALCVKANATVENVVFEPMLIYGLDAHDYKKYSLSNKGLQLQIDENTMNISSILTKLNNLKDTDIYASEYYNIDPTISDSLVPVGGVYKISSILTKFATGIKSNTSKFDKYLPLTGGTLTGNLISSEDIEAYLLYADAGIYVGNGVQILDNNEKGLIVIGKTNSNYLQMSSDFIQGYNANGAVSSVYINHGGGNLYLGKNGSSSICLSATSIYLGGSDGSAKQNCIYYRTNGGNNELHVYGSTANSYDQFVIYSASTTFSANVYAPHFISTDYINCGGNLSLVTNNKYLKGTDASGNVYNLIGFNSSSNCHINSQALSAHTYSIYISGGGLRVGLNSSGFFPDSTGDVSLGKSGNIWKAVYAKSTTISTSDRNKKHDINDLSEVYEQLFLKLQPKSFIFNDGDRVHIGAISQDVEDTMNELGITPLEFAGFCKDERVEYTEYDEDGSAIESSKRVVTDDEGNPIYDYSLRYGEFIFLTIHMVQKALKRLDALESDMNIVKTVLPSLLNYDPFEK